MRAHSRRATPFAAWVGTWVLMATLAGGCASSAPPASRAPSGEATEKESLATVRAELQNKAAASALAHADEAERRFGESPLAEERRALAIDALVVLGQIGEARSRAYRFLERYPAGPYAGRVAARTGVHPVPAMGPNR